MIDLVELKELVNTYIEEQEEDDDTMMSSSMKESLRDFYIYVEEITKMKGE